MPITLLVKETGLRLTKIKYTNFAPDPWKHFVWTEWKPAHNKDLNTTMEVYFRACFLHHCELKDLIWKHYISNVDLNRENYRHGAVCAIYRHTWLVLRWPLAKCPHHVVVILMIKTIIITTTMWCPVESTSSFSKPPVTHSSPGSALPVLISHPSFNGYLGCFQSLNRVNTICLESWMGG